MWLPHHTDIDYVEVYDYNEEADSFDLRFRDEFDFFDYSQWERSDNKTHPAIDSVFSADHAYVEPEYSRLVLDVAYNNKDDGGDGGHDGDDGGHDGNDGGHDGDDQHHDFHVLPPPQDGTLDAAIERAARVGVSMVRQYLDAWSWSMAHPY